MVGVGGRTRRQFNASHERVWVARVCVRACVRATWRFASVGVIGARRRRRRRRRRRGLARGKIVTCDNREAINRRRENAAAARGECRDAGPSAANIAACATRRGKSRMRAECRRRRRRGGGAELPTSARNERERSHPLWRVPLGLPHARRLRHASTPAHLQGE